MEIEYTTTCSGINWEKLRERLIEDEFHNGRTTRQYQISFENSAHVAFAWVDGELIGKARALSDGVCNGYVVDVWTFTPFRRQGVASRLMNLLVDQMEGQHVHLFTDDSIPFYKSLDFKVDEEDVGMSRVIGAWLQNDTR